MQCNGDRQEGEADREGAAGATVLATKTEDPHCAYPLSTKRGEPREAREIYV
jgi:hypothetical protein